MGIQFKKKNPKMNKLFLVCLAFAMVAVAYGLPTEEFNIKMPKEQKQCAAQKFMLNKLATLKKGDWNNQKIVAVTLLDALLAWQEQLQVVPFQLFNGNWLLLVLLLPLALEILVMTVSVKLLNGLVAVMFVKNCTFEINFEKQ